MSDFKLNPLAVKNSLSQMEIKLKEIKDLQDKLNGSIISYKNSFNDEISQKSSELITKINQSIDALNNSFKKFVESQKDIMTDIQSWRSY